METQYSWNGNASPEVEADVRIGQGSVLFSVISAIYLTPLLWQFQMDATDAALIFYIDNGTIVQLPTWGKNLDKLKATYAVIFELVMEQLDI